MYLPRRQLAGDAELMAEVRLLKAKYLGYSFDELDRCALCHGDLHPGGVMVRGADVRVGIIRAQLPQQPLQPSAHCATGRSACCVGPVSADQT